jgi:hypothetical protein
MSLRDFSVLGARHTQHVRVEFDHLALDPDKRDQLTINRDVFNSPLPVLITINSDE